MAQEMDFVPNREQEDVIEFGKGNLLVEAGPCSGENQKAH